MDKIGATWAKIDLAALAGNFAAIQNLSGKNIYAIVKADAYGHGAVQTARTLLRCGAYGFGVANLYEAVQLRQAGIDCPILILGYTPPESATTLAELNLTQCVFSLDYAKALDAAANAKISVHIKLDTGMGRIGFDCRTDALSGIADAKQVLLLKNLDAEGIFMHYAVADTPSEAEFTAQQHRNFCRAIAQLESDGHTFKIKHCGNSAAVLCDLTGQMNAARAGILLYGIAPDKAMPLCPEFKPVMSLYSTVSMVKTVPEGTSISYGRTYCADGTRKIATVSAGYGDGVPRLLSNRGCVLIHGKRAPIVGRVCMDQLCVDVTDIENVKMGDTVTLFGPGLSVNEVAQAADTIAYEILASISKRVARIYE